MFAESILRYWPATAHVHELVLCWHLYELRKRDLALDPTPKARVILYVSTLSG